MMSGVFQMKRVPELALRSTLRLNVIEYLSKMMSDTMTLPLGQNGRHQHNVPMSFKTMMVMLVDIKMTALPRVTDLEEYHMKFVTGSMNTLKAKRTLHIKGRISCVTHAH